MGDAGAGEGHELRVHRRTLVVLEHMQSENVQDWDRTMRTFSHARYELPDGRVLDGRDEVHRFWVESRRRVPDQRNELVCLRHHSDREVVIEFWLRGTPRRADGSARAPFEHKVWAAFTFDEDDLLTNERVFLEPPSDEQLAGSVQAT